MTNRFDTSTPSVATAAPVVRQPDPKAQEVPTLRLSKSPDLLPSFGLSSPSSSPMLPWGTAEDSSPPFSPNRVREGHSQDVPDEGSLFNVSPLSPGLVVRPTREGGAAPSEGILLPTMLEDFDDSVLGDPISYARFEEFPGSESPLSLPVYAWPPSSAFLMDSAVVRTVLAPGKSERRTAEISVADSPAAAGEDRLLQTGLPGGVHTDSWSPANSRLQMETRHMAYSYITLAFWSWWELRSRPDCWTAPPPSFWVEHLGKEQAMAVAINLQRDAGVMLSNLQILSQFAMAMNRMSFQ